jgi:Mg2+ and Co2+ transporter CorA
MLTSIAQSDAEYTAAIAMDGKLDSIAMKTIAILGIIFLPGAFVSSFFSINMFDWGNADSGAMSSLTVSPWMWIYWAITVPLTLVTFLIWVFWSRRETRRSRQRLRNSRTKTPIASTGTAAAKGSSVVPSEKMV